MPPSGYELGMGEFVLPSLGIFIVGVCLVMLAGWLVKSSPKRQAKRWERSEKRLARRNYDTRLAEAQKYIEASAHLEQPPPQK